MAANGANDDIEANENTGLLSGSDGTPETTESEALWQELDRPWPATFERSISLLASPVINIADADHFTKSPKPGNTPLAIRRHLRSENDQSSQWAPLTRRKSDDKKANAAQAETMDFKETKENLLASAKLIPLMDTQKQQDIKAKEAAEYRAKILKQQKTGGKAKKSEVEAAKSHEKHVDGKASFAQCVFNMANILMGVGLLGLPYACSKAGIVGGSCALLTLGLICWRTSILIGRELNGDPRPSSHFSDSPWKSPLQPGSTPAARMHSPIASFPDIARKAFGNGGALMLAIMLYFELFSCVCIFMVSIGDHLHTLFPDVSVTNHMIGCCIVSVGPIILLRTAKLLSYLSLVGTVSTVAVVVTVVAAYAVEGDRTEHVAEHMAHPPPGPYHSVWHTEGIAAAFGLVAYCFSGHAIIPSIYSSMEKPQDFEAVVHTSFAITLAACFAVGLSGYMMFGDLVLNQVSISLEQNSSATYVMMVLTYLMILTAFSKLTLTMFPLSIGMEEIVAPYISSDKAMGGISYAIKVILLVLSLMVAIYVPSFSLLCTLVGMLCTMTVSVIFPAAAYLKLFGPKLHIFEKLMYGGFVVVGLFIAITGTMFGLEE